MTAGMIKILFVEDDLVDRMAVERLLRNHDQRYDYRLVSSLEAARNVLKTEQFDVAVMDYVPGDEIIFDLSEALPDIPIIMTTDSGNEEIAAKARQAGVFAYLTKDSAGRYLEALPSAIEHAIQQKKGVKMSASGFSELLDVQDSAYPEHPDTNNKKRGVEL